MKDHYEELIESRQDVAPYLLLWWDIKEHTKAKDRKQVVENLENIKLAGKYVYNALLDLEKTLNKKIIVEIDEDLQLYTNNKNPIVIFDNYGIKVYRDSIDKDYVNEIMNEAIKRFNLNLTLHFYAMYYDTEKYEEANELIYSGHLIKHLNSINKYFDKDGKIRSIN